MEERSGLPVPAPKPRGPFPPPSDSGEANALVLAICRAHAKDPHAAAELARRFQEAWLAGIQVAVIDPVQVALGFEAAVMAFAREREPLPPPRL